jgi:hypothetical protein
MPFQKMKELVKNLAEKLDSSNQKNDQLIAENKELKSRMRELIGEQKLPEFKAKKNSKERDPNKEYKEPKKKGPGRGKRGKKNHKINIDRKEKLEIDKSVLPDDAQFKGHRKVIIQEIEFRTDNVEFSIPRYYSPSLKKYFEAELPEGYKGFEFGPKLRAFILMMNTQCRVTENKIKSIFDTLGTHISIGHINNITQTIPGHILNDLLFAKETAIEKQKEIHVDASGININGVGHYMQCICNKYFSWFDLLKNRGRYEVLKGVIGTHKVFKYIIDQSTVKWLLGRMKDGDFINKIKEFLGHKFLTEEELELFIDGLNWNNKKELQHLRVGALLSGYQKGLMGEPIKNLISDDAKEYKDIVAGHQLCWIHELRHYRLINIATGFTKETMDRFFDMAWDFYRVMSEYKLNPTIKKRKYIEDQFEKIFEISWDNHHIDSLRKNTIARKKGLLTFLDYPGLEIHNNSCEFDIREKVVKKKISYGHKSIEGCNNGNFWLSLFHTCRKNGITFWEYLIDRYSNAKKLPQLSEFILFSS